MRLKANTAHGGFFYARQHPGVGEDKTGEQGMGFPTTGAIDSLNPKDNTIKRGFTFVGAVFVELASAGGAGSGPHAYGLQVDAE
jgi:hypothetical protein